MTKAKFVYENNLFNTFEIIGHADYAEEGLDIVCAGISASVITSLNLLIKLLNKKVLFNENQEEGYMHFEIIDHNIDEQTRSFIELVINNLYDSLSEISYSYPNHLKIKKENRR